MRQIPTQSVAQLLPRDETRMIEFKGLRDELLPEDPNDEPAEALLTRMRAAATEVITPRRRRHPPKAALPTPQPPRRRGRPRKAAKLASGGSA